MRSKKLILNCDDFGQSRAANEAIICLLEEKLVSSATIMAPAPGFSEAAAWCRRAGAANIGAHLTFTSEFPGYRWGSLTGGKSLQDAEGFLHPTVEEFERRVDARELRAEMRAQFEAIREAGIPVSHADNHMGSLFGLATGRSFLPMVLRECSRRRLPYRLFRKIWEQDQFLASIPGAQGILDKVLVLADALNVPVPDYLVSHSYHEEIGETYDTFKEMMIRKLYALPEGIIETYIHPAAPDPAMAAVIPSWEKREWEFLLPQDADFRYAIRDAGIELTTYAEVDRLQRQPRLRSWIRLWRLLGK
ncbi:polysaccharide deacetylase family protein [Paenibacillus sp. D51F]